MYTVDVYIILSDLNAHKDVAYHDSMTLVSKILGYIGCSIMAVQGLPQLWRVYQKKSAADLSYTTLSIGCIGGGITISYGVLINEPPLYVSVGFSTVVNVLIIMMKAMYQNADLSLPR